MNNSELKNILKDQHRSFDIAVEEKMNYLQGENVFEDGYRGYDNFSSDNEDVASSGGTSYNFGQNFASNQTGESIAHNRGTKSEVIAKKIAMLRGIMHADNMCKIHTNRYGRA